MIFNPRINKVIIIILIIIIVIIIIIIIVLVIIIVNAAFKNKLQMFVFGVYVKISLHKNWLTAYSQGHSEVFWKSWQNLWKIAVNEFIF